MSLVPFVALAVVLFGHVAISVILFNRVHAAAIPCRWIKRIEKLIFVLAGVSAIYLCVVAWQLNGTQIVLSREFTNHTIVFSYACLASLAGLSVLLIWFMQRLNSAMPAQLLSNHTNLIDVAEELGGDLAESRTTKFLSFFPWNQIFQLTINEKEIQLPRLSPALDGFTITHFSDLHFTGQIKKEFFEFIVARANEFESDMIAITGDIVDKEHCLDWLPATLGQLKCEFGPFYVLGNHDKRLSDVPALRSAIQQLGLIDLGSRWTNFEVNGNSIHVAGNEVPWFGSTGELERQRPQDVDDRSLKILLSHSPDQIAWARQQDFDLMLAGHTHGGQIRLPLIGPIVSPSHFGVKYASGTYFEAPTLMHVSRGISGVQPIRINCIPELTKLILRSAASKLSVN